MENEASVPQPHFSILTPTIGRASLERTCRSLDEQVWTDWEHVVCIDRDVSTLSPVQVEMLTDVAKHRQRRLYECPVEHRDWGHGCRAEWIRSCRGKYLIHLDDDDFLSDPQVLLSLTTVTAPWAIFPVLREGNVFFDPLPGYCRTTISSYITSRDIYMREGFPAGPDGTDSRFVEEVLRKYPWEDLGKMRPLVTIERVGGGRE